MISFVFLLSVEIATEEDVSAIEENRRAELATHLQYLHSYDAMDSDEKEPGATLKRSDKNWPQ